MNIKKIFLMTGFISSLIICKNVQADRVPTMINDDAFYDVYKAGDRAYAIGNSSTAVGGHSEARDEGASAFGQKAIAHKKHGTTMGFHSSTETEDSIAIGSNSKANRIYTEDKLKEIKDNIKIDIDDDAKKNLKIREFSVGNLDGRVGNDKEGKYRIFRQITNVAPATENEDATNLGQVKNLIEDKLSNTGLSNSLNSLDKIKLESEGMKNKIAEHEKIAHESVTKINKYENEVSSYTNAAKAYENSAKNSSHEAEKHKIAVEEIKRSIDGIEAINFSQLERVKNVVNHAKDISQKNSSRISILENELSKTNTKIERGLATSAALNGLFQPYGVGKINMTAAIGGYGSSQALAVGTGYRVDEKVAFKAGIAYSGGNDVMYNASFNVEW